ncbi:Ger(x)C family spore germination protein [Paenibacillus sp. strain BS8-2]
MIKKRVVMFFVILMLVLTSTACWDRKEIDKLAIVIGLGIDKLNGTDDILLTAQIVNPSAMQKDMGGGGQQRPFVVTTAEGETVYDAVRNFSKDSPRRLFFSHNSIIVIGDQLARSGIHDILDYFERDPQFRRTSWMLVAPKTAKEILEAKLDLQKLTAIGIKNMINEFHQSSAVRVVQRKDFMSDLSSKSASAVASRIELINESAGIQKKLNEASDSTGHAEDTEHISTKQTKQLRLSGTAVFHKDKLAGYLNSAESRGILWVLGEVKGGAVVAACPGDKNNKVVFRIDRSKKKLRPSYAKGDDSLKMMIEIHEESVIEEMNCKGIDISKPATIKQLEQLLSEDVEKRIMRSVHKTQKMKSDILHFGEAFHRKDPKRWKELESNWGDSYAKVDVTVDVHCKIRRVGMISKSVEIRE